MAEQLWGTYSVADHKQPYAFIADLILYDRLVVPVPPSNDPAEWKRWEDAKWRPERQQLLLKELGDYVKRVQWTPELRAKWDVMQGDEENDTASWVGGDLEMTADGDRTVREGGGDPYGDTRLVLARDQGAKLLNGADARVLSAYANADRFDRHWRVEKSFPFVRRTTEVERAAKPHAVEDLNPVQRRSLVDQGRLATVIVGEFVLPVQDAAPRRPDDRRDHEALVAARKLLEDETVSAKRSALRRWIAKYDPKAIPTAAKVAEFDELLKGYNAAVRAKKTLKWCDTALCVLRPAAAGASLFAPAVGVAASAADGAIGNVATRYFGPDDWQPEDIRGAALISDAQKMMRS